MHTPGRWHIGTHNELDGSGDLIPVHSVYGQSGLRVAKIEAWMGAYDAEIAANARLIAAAPEMLEVLHTCLKMFSPLSNDSVAESIRAAIAKAEGRI